MELDACSSVDVSLLFILLGFCGLICSSIEAVRILRILRIETHTSFTALTN